MRDRVSITELTPLLFLERSADVFPDKTAIRYRDRSITYAEMKAADRSAGAGAPGVRGRRPAIVWPI